MLLTLANRKGEGDDYLRWISATHGDEIRLITMDEIVYFRSDNKYTLVVTPEQKSLIRQPIRHLVEQLDPEAFWQIHRGTVVHVKYVAGFVRSLTGQLEVRLKARAERLPVGETFAPRFRQL